MDPLLQPKERTARLAHLGHGRHGQRFEETTFNLSLSNEVSMRRPPHQVHTKVDGFELVLHLERVFSQQLIILGYNAQGELVEWRGASLDIDFGLRESAAKKSALERLGDIAISDITSEYHSHSQ